MLTTIEPESLDQLIESIKGTDDKLYLYRGQANSNWQIESTFARHLWEEGSVFRTRAQDDSEYYASARAYRELCNEFFNKYDRVGPAAELNRAATDNGLDPWFELMKRYQQRPLDDNIIPPGTNIVDFTLCPYIALFFALEAPTESDAAVWRVHLKKTTQAGENDLMRAVLEKMREHDGDTASEPILFVPPRQSHMDRAEAQQARYFLQCDFRFPLDEFWIRREREPGVPIVDKFIVKRAWAADARRLLDSMGITNVTMYPNGAQNT